MRPIRIGFPSGICKLVLWEGTEDEEAFVIKAPKTKPYVEAYGKKYLLTKEEKAALDKMSKIVKPHKREE